MARPSQITWLRSYALCFVWVKYISPVSLGAAWHVYLTLLHNALFFKMPFFSKWLASKLWNWDVFWSSTFGAGATGCLQTPKAVTYHEQADYCRVYGIQNKECYATSIFYDLFFLCMCRRASQNNAGPHRAPVLSTPRCPRYDMLMTSYCAIFRLACIDITGI